MIQRYLGLEPAIDPSAFVHEAATLIGDVTLGEEASVWPGCVLRGDQGAIRIGNWTSIQDGTIAHATGGQSTTTIGARVVCGHRVILHGCTVGNDCLIGMGSILLDNCEIGDECVIGAGALVPVGRKIPPRSLVLGIPGKVVRSITAQERAQIDHGVATYRRLAKEHRRV
jgi:carbonic anhydrase/acetyltransferase-like protein (isoleucine patch superfamily)